MKLLGPKKSVFCSVVSAFGTVFMLFLGIAYYLKSPALIEDLILPEDFGREEYFRAFYEAGNNCMMTMGVYILTCVFTGWVAKSKRNVGSSSRAIFMQNSVDPEKNCFKQFWRILKVAVLRLSRVTFFCMNP